MRRTWMLLLAVAMLAIFMAVPALASEEDGTRTYCLCGATKDLVNGPKDVDSVEHESWCTRVNLEWKPLTDADVSNSKNCYVPEDGLTLTKGRNFGKTGGTEEIVINIDLNGAEITRASSRVYTVKGCQLNIVDTEGGGRMVGHGGVNTGGVLWMASNAKAVNIYGGTFVQEGQMSTTSSNTSSCGGVIAVNYGTLKLHGGTIEGNENYTTTTGDKELPIQGQAIYIASSKVYLNGGCIKSGDVYVNGDTTPLNFGQNFDNEDYTLKITLSKGPREFTSDLGSLARAEEVARMIEVNGYNHTVNNANKIYAYTGTWGASVAGEDRIYGLAEAIEKANGQKLVTVLADYSENFDVTKDAIVDLNGKTLKGKCTIAEGVTLHLVDSQSLDYTSGGGAITGEVVLQEDAKIARETFTNGMLEDADKNYRFVTIAEPGENGNSKYSAHRIWLGITSTELYPGATPYLGYKISLRCDDKVAQYVRDYGLYVPVGIGACYRTDAAASSDGSDNEKVIGFRYIYSSAEFEKVKRLAQTQIPANTYIIFNDYLAGGAEETGTAKEILDGSITNVEGTVTNYSDNVVLGPTSKPSLKEIVEAADDDYDNMSTSLQDALDEMYQVWQLIMDSRSDPWSIPNIRGYEIEAPENPTPDNPTPDTPTVYGGCICGANPGESHMGSCSGEEVPWQEWDLDVKKYLPDEPGYWILTSDSTTGYVQLTQARTMHFDYYLDSSGTSHPVYNCSGTFYSSTGADAVQVTLGEDEQLLEELNIYIDLNGLKIEGKGATRVYSAVNRKADTFGNTSRTATRTAKLNLNICDSSEGHIGALAAYGTYSGNTFNTAGVPQGCVMWFPYATDTVNLYYSEVDASNVRMGYGVAMYVEKSKVNLYACDVIGGTAQGYVRTTSSGGAGTLQGSSIGGGAIAIAEGGTVTMYGGSIQGGTVIYRYMAGTNGVYADRGVGGGNVYVSKGGKFVVDGTQIPASITGGRALVYADDPNPIPVYKYGAGAGVFVNDGGSFEVKGNVTITGNETGEIVGTLHTISNTATGSWDYVVYNEGNVTLTGDSNVYLDGEIMTAEQLSGQVGFTLNGYEGVVLANADADYYSSNILVADETDRTEDSVCCFTAGSAGALGELRFTSNGITSYSVGYGEASIHPTDNDIRNGLILLGHNNQSYATAGEYTRYTRYFVNTDSAAAGMDPTPAYNNVVGTWEELKATCIAITDEEGDTVLLIAVDACSLSTQDADKARNMVSIATGVPQANITISASHQHSTPKIQTTYWTDSTGKVYTAPVDMTQYDGMNATYATTIFSGTPLGTNEPRVVRTDYAKTFFGGVVAAAKAAMGDRSGASIRYGILDTTKNGNQYNYVRNIAYYKNGVLMGMNAVHHKSYSSTTGWTAKYETDVDTTMQLVLFDRTGTDIIMANFQTHPHMAGGDKNLNINADMVGRFRAVLKEATGANVLYFSGAGGNVNTAPTIESDDAKLPYYDLNGDGQEDAHVDSEAWEDRQTKANVYGQKLAQLADTFMKTSGAMTQLTAAKGFTGDVKVSVQPFMYDIWDEEDYLNDRYGAGTYDRLIEKAKLMINWETGSRKMTAVKFTSSTTYDFDKDGVKDGTHWQYFVGVDNISEKDGDEIFSYYHASAIYDRWKRKYVTGEMSGDFNITAYDLGGIGFVAAPYEMFQENGQQIKGNVSEVTGKTDYTQAEHFYDLGFTVGTNPYPVTIIASYANGGNGYIPSAVGFVNGGYSTDTTDFDYGTGEDLARQFVNMLNELHG